MPQDWRGTEINIGDTVIYTTSDKEIVEGVVTSISPSGRVNVKAMHRQYARAVEKLVNHVPRDNVTVVASLSPSGARNQFDISVEYHLERLADFEDMRAHPRSSANKHPGAYGTVEYAERGIGEAQRTLDRLHREKNA